METMEFMTTEMQWLPAAESKNSKARKIRRTVLFVLTAILVFAASYLLLTYIWAQTTWSDMSMVEIVYHLIMPTEGTATDMISEHIVQCLLPAIIITAVFVAVVIFIRKRNLAAFLVKGIAAATAAIVLANTIASFWTEMGVTEYLDSQSTYSSFIDENYVDPGTVDLVFPEEKRNLIYIFLESTENTFADIDSGGAFETNVIPELTQLSLENENFSGGSTQLNGAVPMYGATWTIAAMFAHTSGLPLSISLENNAMSTQDEFFPGAVTLGDILEDAGYNQMLLIGSDAVFGGRELYFTTHGDYTIRDYYYYTGNGTLPEDYRVWWGYEDLYLYENAKTELEELSSQDEPFNLTMLTVDTHFEDGYVCSLCQDDTDDQYSNVYLCASRQLSEFIEWCSEQDWYEDTTIVVTGDHLTMDADFCDDVSGSYQRTVFTTIINGAAEVEEESFREYTTMDLFPTTLAALGVEIPGNKLGLGTNLYSSESTLLEIYGYDELNTKLMAKSELMDSLTSGINELACDIEVMDYDSETNTVQVNVSNVEGVVPGEDGELQAKVSVNDSSVTRYVLEDNGDGTYSTTIDFADFNYESGTYTLVICIRDTEALNARDYQLGATNFDLSIDDTGSGISNVSPYVINVGNYNYATGYFEVTYATLDTSGLSSINVAVWKQDDQSDLQWYTAVLGEDGIYRVSVNVFDYSFDNEEFIVDIYTVSNLGVSTCIASYRYIVTDE